MRNIIKRITDILLFPYYEYKRKKALKARIEELRKRDPFIYK